MQCGPIRFNVSSKKQATSSGVRNGALLRADLHRLFDQGYVTLTTDLHLEVSRRLREDFSNGRSYYPFHGKPIRCPTGVAEYPSKEYIRWHNENIYLG